MVDTNEEIVDSVDTSTDDSVVDVQENPEAREAFAQALPEFADVYDKLDPDTRDALLKKALANSLDESEEDSQPGKGETKPDDVKTPKSFDIPNLNVDEFHSETVEMLESGGLDAALAKRFADRQSILLKHVQGLSGLVVDSIDEIRNEAVVPVKWQQAVRKVSGATEDDVSQAQKLMKERGGTDMQTALELVVLRRSQPKKADSVTNERRNKVLAAIEASKLTGRGRKDAMPGLEPGRLLDKDYRMKLMMAEEEKKNK